MENNWQTKTVKEVFASLHSGEPGLSAAEAKQRLDDYGLNQLPAPRPDGWLTIFFRQFKSPLIYILLAAGGAVFLLGETVDAGVIGFVLVFNALIGAIQEGKAQNTLAALKAFVQTQATVLRADQELIIPDQEVVPGDLIILEAGERVPADARVVLSQNLKLDEATLTGESEPNHKISKPLSKQTQTPAEQKNMVWKGTYVVAGRGQAVVTSTGSRTVIGRIASELAAVDTEIPLKINIRHLSRVIIIAVSAISFILLTLGLAAGTPARVMFATIVSLAVSIIPEGLPIVMTLVLASGVWRMTKQQALVKKLQAVEALGQARVIAVDKTGTLTKNELMVQKLYLGGEFFEVTGSGYEPEGKIKQAGAVLEPLNHPALILAGRAAAFCASARLLFNEEKKEWRVNGDPTEAALLVLAEKIGFHKVDLERESPLTAEIPFDYKNKYHGTVHRSGNKYFLTAVGAPEAILKLSSKIWIGNGQNKTMDLKTADRMRLEEIASKLSGEGLRVLALAINEASPSTITAETVTRLTWLGFFGLRDALRPEVPEAMTRARAAGIRVVMITGDHQLTARAIAEQTGIFKPGETVLTGEALEALPDAELSSRLAKISVFARMTPENKLRLIQAFRRRGEVVAMTGDGVNDAPSLLAADLGVAMGKIGTEVAKEAADIVLLNDNFGSIVAAVEEGRSIYKTIKKVILYLFSTSLGETLTLVAAVLLGFPLPLLPAQIIWLNLVTDGFLDVALAMEPKERGLLSSHFERPKKYLVDKLMGERMIIMAVPMMVGALWLFNRNYLGPDLIHASTVTLTGLAVFQWFNAWNCRSEDKSIFQLNPLTNKFLVGATMIIILLQLLAIYNPMMQNILKTAPLTLGDWLVILPVATSIIIVEEIRKFFYRRRHQPALDKKYSPTII